MSDTQTQIAAEVENDPWADARSLNLEPSDSIPVPSGIQNAKALLGRARQATREKIAEAVTSDTAIKTAQKIAEAKETIRSVHETDAREMALRTDEFAERVATEVSGFTAGATRGIIGGTAGTGFGLLKGLPRGLTPKSVKRVRAVEYAASHAPDGTLVAYRENPIEYLVDFNQPNVLGTGRVTLPGEQASRDQTTSSDGVTVEFVVVPLKQGRRTKGAVVLENKPQGRVWVYVD